MRKRIAYLLLFTYCLANTELHELARMGAFVAHFQEHKQQKPSTTLIKFIKIHYFSGNIFDSDYQKDQQLPFKTVDCVNAVSFQIPPAPVQFILRPPEIFIPRQLPDYDQSALPSGYLSDIWQPPKFCQTDFIPELIVSGA